MYRPGDFICGGYFLVKQIPRPKDVTGFLPPVLVTLSDCYADVAPDIWADSRYNIDDDRRAAEAAGCGIPADAVTSLVRLFTENIGSLDSRAFPSFAVAEAFYRECTTKHEIFLLGIGLDRNLLPSVYAQQNDDINRGSGLLERLELNNQLHPSGEPLGFEILGFEGTKFHSWLCHDAPAEVAEKLGVPTNIQGYVDSLEDAVRVSQHLKSTGAEPAIWEPWLIVRYAPEVA